MERYGVLQAQRKVISETQVLTNDSAKAVNMIKKMAAEPTAEGTPKAARNAIIPLDYLRRCKVPCLNLTEHEQELRNCLQRTIP